MNIDLKKLETKGFRFELTKDKVLQIWPDDPSRELRDAIMDISALMGFNEMETESLFQAAHNIQIMSVIRKCSNW